MDNSLTMQLIRSVCLKCQLSSIVDTLRKWGRLSEDQLQSIFNKKSKTKVKMAQSVLELVHNEEEVELTTDIAGDLELSYIQLHPRKKMWKVFKLTGGNLTFKKDPRTLRSQLIRELQAKWKDGMIYGNMGYYNGAIWLRIHFDSSKRKRKKNSRRTEDYNPNNSVFVLHFQGSPYLIMSNARVKETTLLTQSLVAVFDAENLSYMQLSDRNVFSLADIALKKNVETSSLHRFKEIDGKENPLSSHHRKRKTQDDVLQDGEEADIVDENRAEKRKRRLLLDRKFGPGPQPALEKLEYKFSIAFRGGHQQPHHHHHHYHQQQQHQQHQSLSNLSGDCKTGVEIKGPSVLEGLRQLATKGHMTYPLPRHLTGVLADQRNSFTVISSSKANTNTSSSRDGK